MLCVANRGLFGGDGAGCAARLLKKHGATILDGLHLRMPDSVCESKLLKKTLAENREIVNTADEKPEATAKLIKRGVWPQEALYFPEHLRGCLGSGCGFTV